MAEVRPERLRTELVLNTFIKLVRAAESVTVRSHKHLAKANLTFGQFAVLEALSHSGPLFQRDIARKILKSPRNITMIVDNLEKRTLVQRVRQEDDRRFIQVHLTEQGRDLFEEVLPRHIRALNHELRVLSDGELIELGRLCKIVGKGEAS